MIFRKDPKEDQVIMTLSSINTANSFFVMVALFLILRPRSGAAIVINELVTVSAWDGALMPQSLALLLLSGVVAAALAFLLTIFIGKRCAGFFHRLPYRKLVIGIIVFITAMVFVFTGFLGLLVLVASTLVGLIAPTLGIRRSHAMGVLLLPVIIMLWPL
jgi:putative membrane protein